MYGIPGMRSAQLPAVAFMDVWRLAALLHLRRRPAFSPSSALLDGRGGYLHPFRSHGA